MVNNKKITNEKQTKSFIIGDMDENDISELQKEGLIVNFMEDDLVVNTPGAHAKMFNFMVKN